MFVLAKSATYAWPVTVSLPVSGGKFEKSTFDAVFKRLPQSKIKELIEKSDDLGGDVGFCREVVVGWKGVTDESGQELSFSQTALEDLLEFPMLAKAIATAYLESVSGARVKN